MVSEIILWAGLWISGALTGFLIANQLFIRQLRKMREDLLDQEELSEESDQRLRFMLKLVHPRINDDISIPSGGDGPRHLV